MVVVGGQGQQAQTRVPVGVFRASHRGQRAEELLRLAVGSWPLLLVSWLLQLLLLEVPEGVDGVSFLFCAAVC